MTRSFVIGIVTAMLLLTLWNQPATAHGGVGTGTPESCTEAAFDTALAGGGVVTFFCGAAPVTITISGTKLINAPTTIDGGERITIRGNGTFRLFDVKAPIFEIKNLKLTGGNANNEAGGAIRAVETKLSVINSTLTENRAPSGGAVACAVCRPLTVLNSIFTKNRSTQAGQGDGIGGGAIFILSGGTVTISGSQFIDNTAASAGGALANFGGNITISSSVFSGNNAADDNGGAIYSYRGVLVINSSRLTGNTAKYSGGALASYRYSVSITNSLLTNNRAAYGGAIATSSAPLSINGSTISGNTAARAGGALSVAFSPAILTNSTISGNTAASGGALALAATGASLIHMTLAGNTTLEKGGSISGDPFVSLSNSIIAYNAGGNCSPKTRVTDAGGNVQFPDATCGGVPARDPLLDPAGLKDNGGPLPTIALQANSPAVGAGVAANCQQFDQRGTRRKHPCSSGAFELS